MSKRLARIERMRGVEREYQVAQVAVDLLKSALRADPSLLAARQLKRAHLELLVAQLEPTYFVRLYSEFEAGLRDVWASHFKKKRRPHAEQLIDALTSRQRVSDDYRRKVHTVRKYRNVLVHEGADETVPVALGRARSFLCTFFSFMPEDW
ncbi:MAG TPA: hypothetical protein VFW33_01790 [Gemmataceae bacterium]|nr:hypothetical protein [Gemmataceae bacterium]